jgi:hypothetical protein
MLTFFFVILEMKKNCELKRKTQSIAPDLNPKKLKINIIQNHNLKFKIKNVLKITSKQKLSCANRPTTSFLNGQWGIEAAGIVFKFIKQLAFFTSSCSKKNQSFIKLLSSYEKKVCNLTLLHLLPSTLGLTPQTHETKCKHLKKLPKMLDLQLYLFSKEHPRFKDRHDILSTVQGNWGLLARYHIFEFLRQINESANHCYRKGEQKKSKKTFQKNQKNYKIAFNFKDIMDTIVLKVGSSLFGNPSTVGTGMVVLNQENISEPESLIRATIYQFLSQFVQVTPDSELFNSIKNAFTKVVGVKYNTDLYRNMFEHKNLPLFPVLNSAWCTVFQHWGPKSSQCILDFNIIQELTLASQVFGVSVEF